MYEVTVEADFSSGHYLRNYKGKCENPHGHNYKVRVTLAGATLDEAGLLLDFKLLKQVLRPVIDRIDHQMLNDLEPFTTLNPSAENIAKYFYDETNQPARRNDRGPRARERLHHLGDRHHHGHLLRVATVRRTAPPRLSSSGSISTADICRRESRSRRALCRPRRADRGR